MTLESIIDAIDSVTWYNGLAERIVTWKNMENYNVRQTYGEYYPEGWLSPSMRFLTSLTEDGYEQLQVIWMICVMLFGDYGTSPRNGWIENKDEFFTFIDMITKTYREAEMEGEEI